MLKRPSRNSLKGYRVEEPSFEEFSPSSLISAPSYTDGEFFPVEARENYDAIMETILGCTGEKLINALKRIRNYPEFLLSSELIETIERISKNLDDQNDIIACMEIIKLSSEIIKLRDELKLSDRVLLALLQSFLNKDELEKNQRTIDNFIISMKNYVI